jgi:hypothetical protein
MTRYANRLQELNWVLRSGGVNGADIAFEHGAVAKKEIFLPWSTFNSSNISRPITEVEHGDSPSQDAKRMAATPIGPHAHAGHRHSMHATAARSWAHSSTIQ